MAKKKSLKAALFTAILSLIVCISMFAGTTFAWFTDSVTSSGNIIASGTLKVGMYWADAKEDPETTTAWNDASTTAIFNYANWEPGYTDAKHVKISNKGTLAFKYEVRIETEEEISELAEVFDVYFVDPAIQISGRELDENNKVGKLSEILENETLAAGSLVGGEEVAVTIVLTMNGEAGNEYQNLSIGSKFAIKVIATQMTYESDSFGNDYDEEASIVAAVFEHGGVANLEKDFNYGVNVVEDKEVVLNLNGNDVNGLVINRGELTVNGNNDEDGNFINNAYGAGLENLGKATITDVTMKAGTPATYSSINRANSEAVYNNVNIVSAGGGIGAADGAKVVFNSGSVAVNSASTSGRYNFYAEGAGSTIIINGGTFSFSSTLNQKRAYIYAGAGTTVYVNGGTFGTASKKEGYTAGILGAGTVIITGGTFGFDPSNWVAGGCNVVKEGSTWTVTPIVYESVDKTLLSAENNGVLITLKAGTYSELAFNNPSSYKAKNVTIVGEEGAVIDGFSISNWTADNNIEIDGLTFKNITFTKDLLLSTKSMANVTVEDCHFVNDARIHQNDKTEKLTNLVVKNCTFTGDKNGTITAIMLENTENVTVTGCTFTDIDFNVLQAGTVSGDVVFDGNVINGTGDRVFRFVNINDAKIYITNNTIVSDGDDNGELAKATNPCKIVLDGNTWNGLSDAEILSNGKLINIAMVADAE